MRKFLVCIVLLLLTNCATKEKTGYLFEDTDQALIEQGVTSKERVLKIMGSPTLTSDFGGEENWIYYSEEVRHFLFFKPKVVSRTIKEVKFNSDNVISSIDQYDLSNQTDLGFYSKYTAVENHDQSWFSAIFSNIGQVKPIN